MKCIDCSDPGYERMYLGGIVLCFPCYEKRLVGDNND